MDSRCLSWLEDITNGIAYADFESNKVIRAAVSYNFVVIGEAMRCIRDADQDLAFRIHEARDIISFRHRLVHQYGAIDPAVVWRIVERDLPALRDRAKSLMASE